MPLRLDIKRKLLARSDRVKSVDFHPTEPWLLVSLYNGAIHIWNHETAAFVKSFEVAQVPVRSAKFIARKSWIVCGSDDMFLRVVNYNTHEKVASFEAHADYIRSVAVHPSQPFVLSSSDDMLIKLWDWDKGWRNVMTFEGHTHYVMQVVFNLKDTNTFASASLDRTIKVWSLGSPMANYTLEGHEKGVNCLEYYPNGDKPYIVTGADDRLVKIWDFQNKTCVQTLEGHSQNISVVGFHPELPVIISGSEDGTVRIWHSNTFRLENTLNYGMERVWAMAMMRGSNDVAFGFDEGAICVKLGREDPAISMDNAGKIVWARQNDIQQAMVKAGQDEQWKDGERLQLPTKDLGSCEVYPQTLEHSPNGRFVVVCGDGEYIIYTALAWRNKAFGNALEFVWAQSNNDYAVREYTNAVRVYKNFQELSEPLRANYSMEGIFGGALLGIKSSTSLNFYDWDSLCIVRRIDVVARQVFWSESNLVAICSDDGFFVLRFNRAAFQMALERGGKQSVGEEGVEAAFEFVYEVSETVRTGCWVGDCFTYTNSVGRLASTVGGQVQTLAHFDSSMYLLGYIARENRLFLADKDLNIVSFSFPLAVIEFQTAVLRGDLGTAKSLLESISQAQKNKLARFLESQNLKELAIQITSDRSHQFDLALVLKNKQLAFQIASELESEEKLKQVGEFALSQWDYGLAQKCLERAKDLNSLLFFYQASGNAKGMAKLAADAEASQKPNIAFTANLLLGNTKECVRLLLQTKRFPEAAFFARTFAPSFTDIAVAKWKEDLMSKNKERAAKAIATPSENEDLFPDFRFGLLAEEAIRRRHEQGLMQATAFPDQKDASQWDLVGELKSRFSNGVPEEALSALKKPTESDFFPAEPLQSPEEQTLLPSEEPVEEQTYTFNDYGSSFEPAAAFSGEKSSFSEPVPIPQETSVPPKIGFENGPVSRKSSIETELVSPKISIENGPISPKISIDNGPVSPKINFETELVSPKLDIKQAIFSPKLDINQAIVSPKLDINQAIVSPKLDINQTIVSPKLDTTRTIVSPKFKDEKELDSPKLKVENFAASPKLNNETSLAELETTDKPFFSDAEDLLADSTAQSNAPAAELFMSSFEDDLNPIQYEAVVPDSQPQSKVLPTGTHPQVPTNIAQVNDLMDELDENDGWGADFGDDEVDDLDKLLNS